jgi:hypothetical protein
MKHIFVNGSNILKCVRRFFFLNNFVIKKEKFIFKLRLKYDTFAGKFMFVIFINLLCLFMCVCYDCLHKDTKFFFFLMREMTLEIKCLLSQFNLFSVKGLEVSLVNTTDLLKLLHWKPNVLCTYYSVPVRIIVYLTGIVRSAHLLSVSPRASHSKAFESMRKGKKGKRLSTLKYRKEIYITGQTCFNTGVKKLLLAQFW